LKWTKNVDDKWLSTGGDKSSQASLGLTIGLDAEASVTSSIFFVEVSAGVRLNLHGARNKGEGIGIVNTIYATTEEDKPAIGGSVVFTGASVTYSYYAEVGGSKAKSIPNSQSSARSVSDDKGMIFNNKIIVGKGSKIDVFKDREWLIGAKKGNSASLSELKL